MRYLIVLLAIVLTSCGPTYNSGLCPEKPILDLKPPTTLDMRQIELIVVTEDNSGAVFRELKAQNIEPVLFGLTGNNYKALSLNIDDILTYIILQKERGF